MVLSLKFKYFVISQKYIPIKPQVTNQFLTMSVSQTRKYVNLDCAERLVQNILLMYKILTLQCMKG